MYLKVSRNPQPVAVIPNTTEKSKSYEIHRNTTVYNRSLEECWISRSREDFRACLKQYLCEVENSSAGNACPSCGSGCKLCPSHWQLHRDKCYWLSKKAKDWTMGHEDCSRKNSHLLMIQDWEEMVFIQNITKQQNEVWIGLNITSPGRSWTWVDGSPLNKKLFTVLGPAEEKSCAAIRNNKIQSESCLTRYCWICQKEAVLI
uniref:C-type lectin domain-containing protein n=1 Tax=Pelusios castaneus TaxID=367368 RepID=A0A8C8VGP0_9SAUR